MVKLKDVAKLAGVSEATVSYVLNGKHDREHISVATRHKVEAAARQLGYKFDDIARGMATGKTNVIGFLPFAMDREYVAGTLAGIMRRAQELNYFVKAIDYRREMAAAEIVGICRSQRLAGLICYGILPSTIGELQDKLAPLGVPLIAVSSGIFPPEWKCVTVTSNDTQGGFLAIKHLLDLGHRRIAVIGRMSGRPYANDRLSGCLRAFDSSGLELPPENVVTLDDDGKYGQAIVAHINRFVGRGAQEPTAYFCFSDATALVVISQLHRLGRRVPEDVSVVGYSDMSYCWYMQPSLTTIREPYQEIGAKAVETIISDKSIEPNFKIVIDVQLIVRESSAPISGAEKVVLASR